MTNNDDIKQFQKRFLNDGAKSLKKFLNDDTKTA